jgi:ABC-2 type transport system ATP-binding protein
VKALEITNLSYAYRHQWSGKRITTLSPFSLSIEQGEAFGFLGHNGAGKTTTIKNILDLVHPASGSITIFGKPHTRRDARCHIGYVPEFPYFYENSLVREAIECSARLSGLKGSDRAAAVRGVLERLGLPARTKQTMRTLSKGLAQRVAIAQAIVAKPDLLILDEPFSGLDPIGRKDIRELFIECKAQGTTLFLASHILSDIEHLCDRVSIMAQGSLKGVYTLQQIGESAAPTVEMAVVCPNGCPSQLIDLAQTQHVRSGITTLTFASEEVGHQALAVAVAQKLRITSYEVKMRSLEDLFVEVVSRDVR